MSDANAINTTFLAKMNVTLGYPFLVVNDEVLVINGTGGTLEGPDINGTVVGPGGDWVRNGSKVDVRVTFQMDDKNDDGQPSLVHCEYSGRVRFKADGTAEYICIAPLFQVSKASTKYAYLNDHLYLGKLDMIRSPTPEEEGLIIYNIYKVE